MAKVHAAATPRLRVLVAATLAFAAAHALAAENDSSPFAGRWEGEISIPAQPLRVEIDIERKDALSGDITIPAQGARDLPLTNFREDGTSITFSIKAVPGNPTFRGGLSTDQRELSGRFVQGMVNVPFKLVRGADATASAATILDGFEDRVGEFLRDFDTPGVAVAVVKDGRVVLSRGYGLRDVEKKLPVTADTLFAIGSSTKAFTTAVLGTLVDEGRIEWDKPVIEYLPEFRLKDPVLTERITVRDLVTHRTGMPRHDLIWYNNVTMSRAEAVRRLRYLEASRDLREAFQYNNAMYLTAGLLIERVTGKTWEDATRERILGPLGMIGANFSVEDSQKAPDHALPHDMREKKLTAIPFRPIVNAGPAGSINASANDMARWVAFQLGKGEHEGKRVLAETTLLDMHIPHMAIAAPPSPISPEIGPSSYGLGWFIDSYHGHRRIHHGGNIDGFSALVALFPDDNLAVVALTNGNGSAVPALVVREVANRFLNVGTAGWVEAAKARHKAGIRESEGAREKLVTVRRPGTKPAHPLEEYAGEYEHPGYGVLAVTLADGRLSGTYNGIPMPFDHWHYETFTVTKSETDPVFEDTKVTFVTGDDGQVSALATRLEPSVAPIEFRRLPDPDLRDAAGLARFVGRYAFSEAGGVIASFDLRGGALIATVPGQPPYTLVPTRDRTFELKGLGGYSVHFIADYEGQVTAAEFRQPNGVFRATRTKD